MLHNRIKLLLFVASKFLATYSSDRNKKKPRKLSFFRYGALGLLIYKSGHERSKLFVDKQANYFKSNASVISAKKIISFDKKKINISFILFPKNEG